MVLCLMRFRRPADHSDFHGRLEGYENVTAQCHNCGNWSAQCVTEWPWFTICFVPIIPLAFGKYKVCYGSHCHPCL